LSSVVVVLVGFAAAAVPIWTAPPVDEANDKVDVSIRTSAPFNKANDIRTTAPLADEAAAADADAVPIQTAPPVDEADVSIRTAAPLADEGVAAVADAKTQ